MNSACTKIKVTGIRIRSMLLGAIATLIAVQQLSAVPLKAAADSYRQYLIDDINRAIEGARAMRERLAVHDLDGARKAWISARMGWEQCEVFTSGFVPVLDQQIDAWPNANHGFHGIEAALFSTSDIDVGAETDALITHLSDLRTQLDHVDLVPQRLLNGIARLAFEIGGNKADGGESRLSGTSLNDMQSNTDGIAVAYRLIFAGTVEASDPSLGAAARATIEQLQAAVRVSDLRDLDADKLRANSEELVVLLQTAASKVGLERPTLEEGVR
jgi:iron uptake system EfeUOB component EfeO/EfeM